MKTASSHAQVSIFAQGSSSYPPDGRCLWYVATSSARLQIAHGLGLYAGLLPKLLQSVLTAAFMFVAQRRIYEIVKGVSSQRPTRDSRVADPQMLLVAAEKRALAARA
jgi:hypothetical protein